MEFISKCCSAPPIGELEQDLSRKVAFGYCKDCGSKSSFFEKQPLEFTPANIKKLGDNEVFVFGSNTAGRHGAGAALTALKHFGAVYGEGEGLQGKSYAIPTKNHRIQTMPLNGIAYYVNRFLEFSKEHPELTFLVTPIGTGLAGLSAADIAPMFKGAPKNVVLPKDFLQLNQTTTTTTK